MLFKLLLVVVWDEVSVGNKVLGDKLVLLINYYGNIMKYKG